VSAATLDTTVAYTVEGYGGVAFRVLGPEIVTAEPEPFVVCTGTHCAHDGDEAEGCWAWPEEPDTFESEVWVEAVMIGDDVVHHVERTSLTVIDDDAYCGGCGQVGCTADGRS
jgi:hypothetical protein